MDPLVFQSQTTGTDQLFDIALGAFIVSLLLSIVLLRGIPAHFSARYRTLLALLFFIVALVAGGTAWFSLLTSQKLGAVEIGADYFISPYGKSELTDIRNAYIEMDRKPSLFNPAQGQDRVRLLLIVENSGKTHVLSEENYPIQKILDALRDRIKQRE